MSRTRVKPTFGREMDPCEYTSKWANKLSKDEVVVIKAEPNKVKEVDVER
ncbi:MAG: hypothetical protein IJE59_04755 [Clostridia bacterium]|nr:hypothetical protein [Clostridia bacterium]